MTPLRLRMQRLARRLRRRILTLNHRRVSGKWRLDELHARGFRAATPNAGPRSGERDVASDPHQKNRPAQVKNPRRTVGVSRPDTRGRRTGRQGALNTRSSPHSHPEVSSPRTTMATATTVMIVMTATGLTAVSTAEGSALIDRTSTVGVSTGASLTIVSSSIRSATRRH